MTDKKFPEGKFVGTVKIGSKGQIVIPKEVRDLFGLKCGDSLLLAADVGQGIALQPFEYAENFWKAVYKPKHDGGDGEE